MGGSSGSGGGNPAHASCDGLPATCGPSGTGNCCDFGVVPGGTFNRGNDPSYPATVSDFGLDSYEITVGRFRKFWAGYPANIPASGAGKNPNNPADSGWDETWTATDLPSTQAALTAAVQCDAAYQTWTAGNDTLPMNCINWFEAQAFCIWDGGRLPTEAEWNYAAAAGSEQRVYAWGNAAPAADASLAVYGCYYQAQGSCSGVVNIAPVGAVSAGDGKWGQADLEGNVWEWTQDWYASPYAVTCADCANLAVSSDRVLRGGSFLFLASYLLSSYRYDEPPSGHFYYAGARCARSL
jgi:sulfatase modifying factor 1